MPIALVIFEYLFILFLWVNYFLLLKNNIKKKSPSLATEHSFLSLQIFGSSWKWGQGDRSFIARVVGGGFKTKKKKKKK